MSKYVAVRMQPILRDGRVAGAFSVFRDVTELNELGREVGIACYYAAMLAGVRVFDCTVGGIGGQVANFLDGVPVKGTGAYYFGGGHTGVVSTEDFVTMVNAMGIVSGVDEKKLYPLGRALEKILGHGLHAFTTAVPGL